jgi:hypothetical protein
MSTCINRLLNTLLSLIALIVIALALAWYFLLPKLDTLLADAVRREFILPPTATVVIERGSIFDTLEGQVQRFRVESPEAKIDGVLVNDLRFDAKGIKFDLVRTLTTGNAELKDVANGELEVKVSEAAIEQRWAAELESKGLDKVAVKLENGKVELSGLIDMKIAKLRVGAKGKLAADGSDMIKFKPTQVDVGGANLDVSGIKAAMTGLTPVVDLGQFKVVILIDKLKAEKGFLIISARSTSLEEHLAKSEEAKQNERERIQHEIQVHEDELKKLKAEEEQVDSGK